MSGKKILFIVGTRPEAIKVWPVIEEMKQQGVEFEILWSGQHSDLVKINFNEFGFRVDFQLNSVDRKNTLGVNTGDLIKKFSNFLSVFIIILKFIANVLHLNILLLYW